MSCRIDGVTCDGAAGGLDERAAREGREEPLPLELLPDPLLDDGVDVAGVLLCWTGVRVVVAAAVACVVPAEASAAARRRAALRRAAAARD
ncbi:hypothetical protein, partial [Patulibacter medicamentivorans]|uniref:hypothetical protein n=1 Tax=Patulibacter medicamentivorans TaxID=1097667 RepID=UPI00058CA7C4